MDNGAMFDDVIAELRGDNSTAMRCRNCGAIIKFPFTEQDIEDARKSGTLDEFRSQFSFTLRSQIDKCLCDECFIKSRGGGN